MAGLFLLSRIQPLHSPPIPRVSLRRRVQRLYPAAAINASITYMKAAREGSLHATAEEFAKNPRLATYVVTITDDAGDRIALFQGMVYRKRANR